jgi:hypothetical protein
VPSATPAATPVAGRGTGAGKLAWIVGVAAGGGERSRSIRGGDVPLDMRFAGAGAAIDASLEAPWVLASIDASYTQYSFGFAEVTGSDGTTEELGGGSVLGVRAGVGPRLALGGGRTSIALTVGAGFESVSAKDAAINEVDQGLITSTQETLVDARLDARIGVASSVSLLLGGGAALWRSFAESPEISGDSPEPGMRAGWKAGIAVHRGATDLVLGYSGTQRVVSFSGPANAEYDPTLEDAEITEASHTLSLGMRYHF